MYDVWIAFGHFYNVFQASVMRELQQQQKAKSMKRAQPEDDLRISVS